VPEGWLALTTPELPIVLSAELRRLLADWLRDYGEATHKLGTRTGSLQARLEQARVGEFDRRVLVWTTARRWSAGEGLLLRLATPGLQFACHLRRGNLIATHIEAVDDEAVEPTRERGSVGAVLLPESIELAQAESAAPSAVMELLEQHFRTTVDARWSGMAGPLRAALDAEVAAIASRSLRLTTPFARATRGTPESADWRLSSLAPRAIAELDPGEWLEILDPRGSVKVNARVRALHPAEQCLDISLADRDLLPPSGFVRPRARERIVDQKRALLHELEQPTGDLVHLVQLVASPALAEAPLSGAVRQFANPAILPRGSQARAVELALGLQDGQTLLIQGPPGTGKSTTAAEISVQLLRRDPRVRILVCSHSNHGTDNILTKVVPFLPDATRRLARVGLRERVRSDATAYYVAPGADLAAYTIVFTTIDSLALQDRAGAHLYDYAILDEANRAGVLDSMLALARGRRFMLIGDAMQLQPVVADSMRNTARHAPEFLDESLFTSVLKRGFPESATVFLNQQNRMHPVIGELVSRVFYSNRVGNGRSTPPALDPNPVFADPLVWVDTRALVESYEVRGQSASLSNAAEGELVARIVAVLGQSLDPSVSLGVVAAYADQRDLIRRLIIGSDAALKRTVEVETVDAFEGREKDAIVISLVRSNPGRRLGFLELEQRLNVAISRARRLLVIVGDSATLSHGAPGRIFEHVRARGGVVDTIKVTG
jgi:hypothetical protein